jgi:hypothetical protein
MSPNQLNAYRFWRCEDGGRTTGERASEAASLSAGTIAAC